MSVRLPLGRYRDNQALTNLVLSIKALRISGALLLFGCGLRSLVRVDVRGIGCHCAYSDKIVVAEVPYVG